MADLPSDSSTNELPSEMERTDPMIGELVAWASQHGTILDSQVEIYFDHITGLSFRAHNDISLGTPIAVSSPATSLSYLNATESLYYSRHSDSFPPAFIAGLEGSYCYVIGHFFLVQQYLLGQNSFWYPYIRTLPQPHSPEGIPTPVGWSEEDLTFLKDTVRSFSFSLPECFKDETCNEDKMLICHRTLARPWIRNSRS